MSSEDPFSRNSPIFTRAGQDVLKDSRIAVLGVGGDGGVVAEGLARMGVGSLITADPEAFDRPNATRQTASNINTIGVNKAIAVSQHVKDIGLAISDSFEVITYPEGVTRDNIEGIVSEADLIVDETDFTHPDIGIMIGKFARLQGIPVVMAMNVAFGANVRSFHPNGPTLEDVLGVDTERLNDGNNAMVDAPLSEWLPYVPPYVDLEEFKKVAQGLIPAPSVYPGVGVAGSLAVTEVFKVIP